jgi:hypothetical protein
MKEALAKRATTNSSKSQSLTPLVIPSRSSVNSNVISSSTPLSQSANHQQQQQQQQQNDSTLGTPRVPTSKSMINVRKVDEVVNSFQRASAKSQIVTGTLQKSNSGSSISPRGPPVPSPPPQTSKPGRVLSPSASAPGSSSSDKSPRSNSTDNSSSATDGDADSAAISPRQTISEASPTKNRASTIVQ